LNSNGNGNILDNTIAGNIGNNKLDGADGNDKLIGNSGNDVLTGGVGDDAMSGGYGGDILTGGVGNDAMSGGYGGDILTGGAGEDNMNGGAGSDKFLYDTNAIFASSAVGTDRIADFVIGTDKIVLDQTTFTDLTSTIGNGFSVTSEFAVVGSDAAASTTEALIVYSSATDHLFYNQNGSAAGLGSGANFATLSGIDNLSADDFVLQA
ncbi:MAG: calcium-binding protein, partial [Waterburya sp.]